MVLGRRHFVRIAAAGAGAGLFPVRAAKAASCILVWQSGGCSHLDTFDPKPEAPAEIRGDFRAIPTRVPGIRVSECLPRIAAQMDKLTVLRSMRADETNHERAARLFLDALKPDPTEDFPQARALDRESPSLRDRYGRGPLGQACLAARRAVQAGARLVTVTHGDLLYDTHADHFRNLRERILPEFDRAFAALVEDLHERRLLDTTLVIAMGEFGRSPRINASGGRDHHAEAWSVCLAGARIPGGRILGATDRKGLEVTEFPVEPAALLHGIHALLGREPGPGLLG